MKTYEYKVIDYDLVRPMVEFKLESKEEKQKAIVKFEAWLNSHGLEGWQFVGRGDEAMIFIREKKT